MSTPKVIPAAAAPVPMLNYFSEQTVTSWEQLENKLTTFDSGWAFRGQGDATWKLETSIERIWTGADRDVAEQTALALYGRRSAGLRLRQPVPKDSLMMLAEMQHFGAPTRLQDWTKSFYVAAFFAFEAERRCTSAAVWAIDLAWLKAQALTKIKKVDPAYDILTVRDDLNSASLDLFSKVVLTNQEPFVMPVTTFEMNERLGIQQGLFLCPGDVRMTFEENLLKCDGGELRKHCLKFILPYKHRGVILDHLRQVNITPATLYPGLEGFARSINTELFLLSRNTATFNKLKGGVAGALNYL